MTTSLYVLGIVAGSFAGSLLIALVFGRCCGMRTSAVESLITKRFEAEAWAAMTPELRRAQMRLVGSEISPVALPQGKLARSGDGVAAANPSRRGHATTPKQVQR